MTATQNYNGSRTKIQVFRRENEKDCQTTIVVGLKTADKISIVTRTVFDFFPVYVRFTKTSNP